MCNQIATGQVITAEQYRTLSGGSSVKAIGPRGRIKYSAPKTGLIEVKGVAPEDGESVIRHHLRAMGAYFDLDENSVKFYIRQLELSKKI